MSCHRTIIRLSAVLAVVALATGCGDGDSATAPPTPEPARPTTVTVSPATHELTALGITVQLSAEVRDQNARVMAGATVTWTSSANSVATVDASGLVTAAGNGTATITASAGSASGSAVVTVTQSVASVEVSPSVDELTALGQTVQLTAEAFDENGYAVAGAEFSWESSDVAVATVDAGGLVTGVAAGMATITASAGEASGSAVVTVMQSVASVEVSPSAQTIALGSTLQLTAEAFDENGEAVAEVEFAWETSDAAVATVDAGGLVTGVAAGMATITASAGEASGSAVVTVTQSGASVEVSPSAQTIALGSTLQLTAEAFDENGDAVAGAEFSWESSDAAVATVDAGGLVTGVAAGMATITASAGEASGSSVVTVTQSVASVEMSPSAQTIALGSTLQLTAEAFDENGDAVAGAEFSWESSDAAVATVDAGGLVTGVAAGMATITASAGEASGSSVVTVTQSVASVEVSPSAQTIELGSTLQLTAEAFDENGEAVAEVEFAWETSDAAVAAVDAGGLVTGVAVGTATITASAGSGQGTAEVTVADLDRAALVALYEATDGPNWVNSDNWLTDAPLGEWYGVRIRGAGRVFSLRLSNGLKGVIPSELGNLSNLEFLHLSRNQLTGPIPPELGNLSNLTNLNLRANDLEGPIPPELGNLSNLTNLDLGSNGLTGPIPAELGNLSNLTNLDLGSNGLTGPIPAELGNLSNLTNLDLGSNGLTGPIPAELGNLSNLTDLILWANDLEGPIPRTLLELDQLTRFWFRATETFSSGGTRRRGRLCAPGTSAFVDWLQGIEDRGRRLSVAGRFCNETDVVVLESLYEATSGTEWTTSAGWLGDAALEQWHGVSADPLGRVTTLDLGRNGLAGRLPRNWDGLTQITELRVGGNPLTGRLPLSLTRLSLEVFHYAETGLCTPAEVSFREWLNNIASHDGTGAECASLLDRDILEALYDGTDGPNWNNRDQWLTDAPLEHWYGVQIVDGRVVELHLLENGLAGPIPHELGSLANLIGLELGSNHLSGPIPRELGHLSNLQSLSLHDNRLTGAIPSELGSLANLTNLDLRGPFHSHGDDDKLTGAIPPELGSLSSLERLLLWGQALTGPIPPELGNLSRLTTLSLEGNHLTGPIPSELGNLSQLTRLWLQGNNLTGPIPSELGNLSELTTLSFEGNHLTGPIPPGFGNFPRVIHLRLHDNALTGPLPPRLGELSTLEELSLQNNDLSGSVPPEFGGMSNLRELELTNNPAMEGALPADLTALHHLDVLGAGGTSLCAPADASFQAWLDGVYARRLALCVEGESPAAYLTQAVQSRDFPVPLVAGEKALLRVFPTARQATGAGIPPVRARLYLNGVEAHVEDIPGKSTSIPTELNESSFLKSANAEIPGDVVKPGLEMVIEIDPDGTLDPTLGVTKRIPETGRIAVEVREMPLFDLTVIPFLWSADPDLAVLEISRGMAGSADGHELLRDTRTLLPVGSLEVTAHEPVLSSSRYSDELLAQTEAIRVMEGGTGHYLGLMSETAWGFHFGIAPVPGRSSVSTPSSRVIAHELGHNMSLFHAPCDVDYPDLSFPYPDGSIGAWGYDFRDSGRLVHPRATYDLMSYCSPGWVSDYHFSNALRFRLSDAHSVGLPAPPVLSAPEKALLLWGGVGADTVPFLNPALVVDAPAVLPDSAGVHRITGRTTSGVELFSLSFTMPEVADSDGSSSFAFVLPVRPGWEANLASITLSGPGGSAILDSDTDLPMTILLDPVTGQVRAILRDLPQADAAAALTPQAGLDSLEVLFSRGIPDGAAWRR